VVDTVCRENTQFSRDNELTRIPDDIEDHTRVEESVFFRSRSCCTKVESDQGAAISITNTG